MNHYQLCRIETVDDARSFIELQHVEETLEYSLSLYYISYA